MATESPTEIQARIDAVDWYHVFDFGNGLKSKSVSPPDQFAFHQRLWKFIEAQLDKVDFRGKAVLDVGCWDGYWSFAAEKRGAKSVLASDDLTQNWSAGRGIGLARELLGSKIEVDLARSVYDIAPLGPRFDVILFLGVYYHLHAPYYALSQLRHCCRDDTLVLVEGNIADNLPPNTAQTDLLGHANEFFPTMGMFRQLLQANYFHVESVEFMPPPEGAAPAAVTEAPVTPVPPARVGYRWRLGMALQALKGSRDGVRRLGETLHPTPAADPLSCSRVMFRCTPFRGENPIHDYAPAFGLAAYDPRFAKPAG